MKNKIEGKNQKFTEGKDVLGDQIDKAEMKKKMYCTIYEELNSSDDTDLDVALINECVTTLDGIMKPSKRITEPDINAFIQQTLSKHERNEGEKQKTYRTKMLKRVAGFVFVFILSNVAVTQALDIHIWKHVVQWGEDTFDLNISKSDASIYPYEPNDVGTKEQESIEDVLTQLGVQAMVPKYIPEGYIFQDAKVNKLSELTQITCAYSSQDAMFFYTIQLLYTKAGEVNITYEKDKEIVEVYEKEGIDFYILKNLGQRQVIWNVSNETYSIIGNLTVDELKKMIDSLE